MRRRGEKDKFSRTSLANVAQWRPCNCYYRSIRGGKERKEKDKQRFVSSSSLLLSSSRWFTVANGVCVSNIHSFSMCSSCYRNHYLFLLFLSFGLIQFEQIWNYDQITCEQSCIDLTYIEYQWLWFSIRCLAVESLHYIHLSTNLKM